MTDDPFAPPETPNDPRDRYRWLGPRNMLFIAGAVLGTLGIVFTVPALAVIGLLCWVVALVLAYARSLRISSWIQGFFDGD